MFHHIYFYDIIVLVENKDTTQGDNMSQTTKARNKKNNNVYKIAVLLGIAPSIREAKAIGIVKLRAYITKELWG